MNPGPPPARARKNRRRALAALLVLLISVVVAGCGGCGDDKDDTAKAPIGKNENFAAKKSLVSKGDSASAEGAAENYVPEGELVADSGFRPEADGFAFENYGNDAGPINMTSAEMVNLFGEVVCLDGSGEPDCELTPAATEWMNNQNEGMAGGHCEGFSIAALRMYNETLSPADYGADATIDLDVVGNNPLQQTIAENFVYQFLPSVVDGRVKGTPSSVLDTLMEGLGSGENLYTLGVYKPDFTGGHAITPFAVEDKGDGEYAILVYDNNFPGTTRAVNVNTNDETWNYTSGTNPDDLGQVYEGDATTNTLELDPTPVGDEYEPCPFCDDAEAAKADDGKGSVLAEDKQYTELTLGGDPRNHPHLVFTDDEGNRTGIVGGKMLQEIPDVEVVKTYATQNWEGAPEPRFRLPEGADYTISVDGTDLKKTATTTINLVGNGLVIEIEEIKIAPGQKDEMALPGGYGITYQTNGEDGIAPNFFAGLEKEDAAYNFAASAVGLKKGSTLSFLVEQEEEVVILDSTGAEGEDGGNPLFILQLTKADADGNISLWQKPDLELDGTKEEKAGFQYGETPDPDASLPIILLDKNTDVIDTVEAEPQEVKP